MFFLRIVIFFFPFFSLFGGIPDHILINKDGSPSDKLLEVLEAFSIKHDGTWESIKNETQKQWLNADKERWEIEAKIDPCPEKSYCLFSLLDMTQSIWADQKNYDYGVILGGTVQRVRSRFWFLKKLWDSGICFHTLVILTGDRALSEDIENAQTLLDPAYSAYPFRENWVFNGIFPKNETELTKLIFDQLALPDEWRQMPIVFVDTPKPPHAKRPNTADTFEYWMCMNPKKGSVLSVSNQPFIGRQNLIGKKYLRPEFYLETVGEGFSFEHYRKNPRGLPVLLDELARWIYETVDEANVVSSFNREPCLYER